ncbi:hypothetical protein BBUWI9123_NPC0001, partial (plasmid) [Borreliella burgdorferi WI91-23]
TTTFVYFNFSIALILYLMLALLAILALIFFVKF